MSHSADNRSPRMFKLAVVLHGAIPVLIAKHATPAQSYAFPSDAIVLPPQCRAPI